MIFNGVQASLSLQKLLLPASSTETAQSLPHDESEKASDLRLSDYSKLFGDEFLVPDENWDVSLISLLDISLVEEGMFHMLYACAAQVCVLLPIIVIYLIF